MHTMNHSALIVEGGAMRGIFASGVLDAFLESRRPEHDMIFGVSAGAANLLGYLSEQRRRSYHIITRLAGSPRFYNPLRVLRGAAVADVNWLLRSSFERYPLDMLRFARNARSFYAVATDVETGQPAYLKVSADNLMSTLYASCALPLVQREMPSVEGKAMADGGISDSIPVLEAYRRGARQMTVILSEPWGYRLKPIRPEWMVKRLLKTHPALGEALLIRDRNYNAALDFIANPPPDCQVDVIAPPPWFGVSRFTQDIRKLDAGYLQGYWSGRQYMLNQFRQQDRRLPSVPLQHCEAC